MKQKYIIDNSKILEFGVFFVQNKSTIRKTAQHFQTPKSSMHTYLKKIEFFDYNLFLQIKKLLGINNDEKHLRGGIATKNKFKKLNTKK